MRRIIIVILFLLCGFGASAQKYGIEAGYDGIWYSRNAKSGSTWRKDPGVWNNGIAFAFNADIPFTKYISLKTGARLGYHTYLEYFWSGHLFHRVSVSVPLDVKVYLPITSKLRSFAYIGYVGEANLMAWHFSKDTYDNTTYVYDIIYDSDYLRMFVLHTNIGVGVEINKKTEVFVEYSHSLTNLVKDDMFRVRPGRIGIGVAYLF